MSAFNLEQHQLTVSEVHRNLPPGALYEHAIRYEKDASIAGNGALVAYSGAKTGRSPKDKRVVEHPNSKNDIWWGNGFTEWSNVARAAPNFPGHRQPVQPSTLGFYDLSTDDARRSSCSIATRLT